MTCLSGDCVVLVTITVTTDSYTKGDTVLLLVLALCAPLSAMGLVTQYTVVISTICALGVGATAVLMHDTIASA